MRKFTVQESIAPYGRAVIAAADTEYPPCRAIMVNKEYVAEDSTTAFTDSDGASGDTSGTGTQNFTRSGNNINDPVLYFADDWHNGDTAEATTLDISLIADGSIYPFSLKKHGCPTNTIIFLY